MKAIYENLWIGSAEDYEERKDVLSSAEWFIVQACKEPYHRLALRYTTKEAPQHSSEYLVAQRENRWIMNLVDPHDDYYIPLKLIENTLFVIDRELKYRKKVFVHCNKGKSRAPTIGMLYLLSFTNVLPIGMESAAREFYKLYPAFAPGKGMSMFITKQWNHFLGIRRHNGIKVY